MKTLRILHLTDLHIGWDGRVQAWVDDRYGHPELRKALEPNTKRDLIQTIQRTCGPTEDLWPKAIIVSGDLVNFGGGDYPKADGVNREFEHATKFLNDLSATLKVEKKRVFVVPGNHDVNWGKNLDYLERFKGFIDATQEFSAPTITNGQITPRICADLSSIVAGIKVELALLVSPTFSGTADPENAHVVLRLRRMLADLNEEHLNKISEILTAKRGSVDIAAVGQHQRDYIQENPDRDVIRMAVLHHHLLPDPSVDIAQFESVLDAGLVLEQLIKQRFDLVLSGHKHNRRLVQYAHKGERVDVYSGASAFAVGSTMPEFTLIDVFGASSPAYARLTSYNARDGKATEGQDLVREGLMLPEVLASCGRLTQRRQRAYLLPLLQSVDAALTWRDEFSASYPGGAARYGDLFELIANEHRKQLRAFGEDRTLAFSGAQLYDKWTQLITLAREVGVDYVHVVSRNDLDFWLTARVPNTDAWRYAEPLRSFRGEKIRIMVVPRKVWQEERSKEQALAAIDSMIEDGFKVAVVWEENVPEQVRTDFGLIGKLVTSRFLNMRSPTEARTLQERFARADIEKAERDWDDLTAIISLHSDDIKSLRA